MTQRHEQTGQDPIKPGEKRRGRRAVTLVIRAFANEDGSHYGVVSDPGVAESWEATFSEDAQLIQLVLSRLADTSGAVRDAYPDVPGPRNYDQQASN